MRGSRTSFVLLVILLLAVGCTTKATAPPPTRGDQLRIATATEAGVYYPVGLAMVQLFADRMADLKPQVLTTGGGPENIDLLLRGEAEIGFTQAGVLYNTLADAKTGRQVKSAIRGMTYLYPNVMHLVVRKDAGIDQPQDLAGKRYLPGPRESAALINSAEILSLYGLELTDMELAYMGYEESADALIEGRADAALIPGGMPTPSVAAMLRSGKAELLPLEPPLVMKRYPWYTPFTVPAGAYPNMEQDVRTVAVANVLIARSDLPDDLVYQLMKSLFEGEGRLQKAHPAADLKPEEALRGITGVIELHPGAVRYLKEVGALR